MSQEEPILQHDPLSDDKIVSESFYGKKSPRKKARGTTPPKPTHYKVICISMYMRDIENLEAKVAELKKRGHTKANKSQLIRMALNQLDLDALDLQLP